MVAGLSVMLAALAFLMANALALPAMPRSSSSSIEELIIDTASRGGSSASQSLLHATSILQRWGTQQDGQVLTGRLSLLQAGVSSSPAASLQRWGMPCGGGIAVHTEHPEKAIPVSMTSLLQMSEIVVA